MITGIAGFAGSHLADLMVHEAGMELFGVSLPSDSTRNLTQIMDRITLRLEDLADMATVRALWRDIRPDLVFHLAAQASVGRSWSNPAQTLVNNMTAQVNLLQAAVEAASDARILVIGSADEYGAVTPDDLPVSEDTPLRPLNPYAVSKLTQDFLGLQYYLSHKLNIVRVRPFNHIGPRQAPGFVVADFCKQIAEIEAGLREPVMKVGNLSAQRDFTHVRDMVRGYWLALQHGTPGEVYNIGSGQAYSIQTILDKLVALSNVAIKVEQDPERMRPSDIPVIYGDSAKFKRATGWEPTVDLVTSLRDTLDYWRASVRPSTSPGKCEETA